MPTPLPRVLVCALALFAAASASAEPAVIALARSYLGPDSSLDGISTIHLVGTLDRVNPDNPKEGAIHGTLDLFFAKPLRQRLAVRAEKATMTTVLDGYDAWDYLADNADPAKFQIKWLAASEIKMLRANTWENLNFFRGIEGSVEDKGVATMDGIACEHVDFVHGPGIVYQRFFDRDTGRLVVTIRGEETIREQGEIIVEGVRFARSIVSTTRNPSGTSSVSTVTFSNIWINGPVPPGTFDVPSTLSIPGSASK